MKENSDEVILMQARNERAGIPDYANKFQDVAYEGTLLSNMVELTRRSRVMMISRQPIKADYSPSTKLNDLREKSPEIVANDYNSNLNLLIVFIQSQLDANKDANTDAPIRNKHSPEVMLW